MSVPHADLRSELGHKASNANGNSERSEIFSFLNMYKNRITINLYDLFKIKYDFSNKNSFYRNLWKKNNK